MHDDADTRSPLVYQHRARPYSPEARFELRGDHVAIEQGRRKGNFSYRDIVLIRLLYKPRNTTNEGYLAKMYRSDKRTASLTNLSWKSLVDMERQDADYTVFVRNLITRTAEANPAVVLEAGMARWFYALTALAGAAALAALLVVAGHALRGGSWPVTMMAAALGAYFVWWSYRYLSRNRPRRFTPDAIPADVLPPASDR
ncbi:MAG: hypothetical protein ACRCTI_08150 [Beijerinckiaceae bacterium]